MCMFSLEGMGDELSLGSLLLSRCLACLARQMQEFGAVWVSCVGIESGTGVRALGCWFVVTCVPAGGVSGRFIGKLL